MVWIFLLLAGVLEVVWAFTMKQSEGFTKPWPTVITLLAMVASFYLLALSMKQIPLGTAYAIWTGIGTVGAFAVGVIWLDEPIHTLRLIAVGLIVAGLVLLKATA